MNKTKVREWDDVVGGERLTKEEYQRILKQSEPHCRGWFMTCAHAIPLGFAGQIERVTKDKICFKRIYVSGMYPDGICFDGKEDHVWMDLKGFEEYSVGDSLEFFAEVYRYLKTSNGKLID
ncbi:MAG: hypothetical protein HUJ71_07120 [Pseudobutyrivibrio sp.]|nr:hypothetical protein [Pseudobutyrivibrio sp.]